MALTISEMVASTLQYQDGQLFDEVTANNAILTLLKKKKKLISGGYEIRVPVMYQSGATTQWFSDYETLNTTSSENVTTFTYPWSTCCTAVSIDGTTVRKNSGNKEQLLDILSDRIDGAKAQLANDYCYKIRTGDGTNVKELLGLPYFVDPTPATGTIGGVARADYSWSNNATLSFASDVGASMSAANIQSALFKGWVKLVRGTDKPDLIVAGKSFYQYFHDSLSAIARLSSADGELASAGFRGLEYMGATMVLDEAYGDTAAYATAYAYMLSLKTSGMQLIGHKDLFFTKLGEDRVPIDSDSSITFIGAMSQLVCGAPMFNLCFLA